MGEFMGFFDKFNTQLKQTIAKQESEINELKQTIIKQESEINESKNQISVYEQQIQRQNQILSDKENQLRQTFFECEKLRSAIHDKDTFIQTQTIHLQAVETAHTECLKKANDQEFLNQLLTDKINSLEKRKNDIVEIMNQQIIQLFQEIDDITSEKDTLENELQSCLNQIQKLQEKYSPFIGVQNYEDLVHQQMCELKKQIYLQKFLFVLNIYCMEVSLQSKRKYFRSQYEKIKKSAQETIKKYEEDLCLEEYKTLRPYISESDFYSHSVTVRNQMALDNYNKMNKTPTEVGLAYERFIGYLYEIKGYEVRYHGALNKFKDKGIDLYALNSKEALIIQCKRWNKNAIIGDATIRALHGSVGLAQKKFSAKQVKGILYTTTKVSEEAKKEAKALNIEIFEEFPLEEYPKVKCNVSATGEKIYHLPFDQLYDRMFIKPKHGDLYVATVEDAVSRGFRHAHRWDPTKK